MEAFGPPAQDQGRLLDEQGAARRARLGEAVRQARQAAGESAAMRVLDVDPDSRLPGAAVGARPLRRTPRRGARGGERRAHPGAWRAPRTARVRVGEGGVPVALAGAAVDSVREDWVVEDRWWTGRPVRRRYFELVLEDGRNVVVFHNLSGGGWFTQRG